MGTAWPSRDGEPGGPKRIEELARIRAYTAEGLSIDLLSVVQPVQTEAPNAIVHAGGERALTVLGKNEGRPLAAIIEELRPKLDELKRQWAPEHDWRIAGKTQETADTFASAGIALVMARILVFGVLVIVFGSFAQAFILISIVPLAMIGVIALIGIVVNDGIVMVDTMNKPMASGCGVAQAAARGGAERLRPIVTTSLTTIIGLIPMAIVSPAYRPLCYSIIFGLMTATVVSLFVIPALFLLCTPEKRANAQSLD